MAPASQMSQEGSAKLSHPRSSVRAMALRLPSSLSPSKVTSFKDCALAFRFSAIDRLPEPPSPWTTKGTLVHRALELLFGEEPEARTVEAALHHLGVARADLADDPDFTDLHLTPEEEHAFFLDAERLVRRYFDLEDPRRIRPIGLELKLEAQVGTLKLRGIIDRLELDERGDLVVTDYKTGKPPRQNYEQKSLGGVHFYAFLCEQLFGQLPSKIQLLYLSEPVAIVARPSEQSTRGLRQRVGAIWTAVERACEREDFRPRPSALCAYCAFQSYCPAFGGDPAEVRELVGAGAG